MKNLVKDTIHANGIDIGIYTQDFENEFISLTDIARYKSDEPKDVIKNWMRSKDTIEFLGLWEKLHNSNFKGVEFDSFRNQAGSNAFTMSPTKWIETTANYLNNHGYTKKLRQNGTIPGFSSSFIKKIIDNQVYMGKIAYGRRRTEKKTGTRNETHVVEQSEFPVYEGIHEANLDVTDIHYDKKFQICRDD